MNAKQISILNSLVTYAAENVPGGLSDDEHVVVQTVAAWMLGARRTHNYKVVNASVAPTLADVANSWADLGWRVVGVVSDTRPGCAHQLVLERPAELSHPDD